VDFGRGGRVLGGGGCGLGGGGVGFVLLMGFLVVGMAWVAMCLYVVVCWGFVVWLVAWFGWDGGLGVCG
jgi:hypothetical protein